MKSISKPMTVDSSAIHLLHRAGQCADELFTSNIGTDDLTPRQFAILKAVSEHDEPSQTALVVQTGIDRSTLADIVRRLVQRGLLHRNRTQYDARKYAVRLTDKGGIVLARAVPAVSQTNARLLAALPDECRKSFLASLAKIVEAIDLEPPSAANSSAA